MLSYRIGTVNDFNLWYKVKIYAIENLTFSQHLLEKKK